MKRLLEDGNAVRSAPERALRDLIRGVGPLELSPDAKKLVFDRVAAAARGAGAGSSMGVGAMAKAAAIAAPALAIVGVGIVVHARRPPREASAGTVAPIHASEIAAPAAAGDPAPEPAPAPSPVDSAAPEHPATAALHGLPAAPHRAAGEDPGPVLQAIRALRTDRDPARATALLSAYLRSHHDGVLAEDARALLIEAAVARGDAAEARAAARRYLATYPRGRYAAFAEQVEAR